MDKEVFVSLPGLMFVYNRLLATHSAFPMQFFTQVIDFR